MPRLHQRALMGTASFALVAACGLAPLQPDTGARAPALEGFGRSDLAITSPSADARLWFNRGVLQAYAFNEKEAIRQFKAALARDPACAMCAWGVAWQLGPNINAPQRGDLTEARRYVVHALRHADAATPRERALIDAMALRYGEAPREPMRSEGPSASDVCRSGSGGAAASKADALDVAYAERLRALVLAYPDDADILSLYAEAAMIATPEDWWDSATGRAMPRIADLADRLERLAEKQPQHTGVAHYLIHATDAGPAAARAVAAADRLAALAPAAPHLVHMPAHTFVRVGRYADAAATNQRAIAADEALAETQKTQGFESSKDWRGHNTHFLWYASLMQGRGDVALDAARTLVRRAEKRTDVFAEYARSLPLLTLLRLQRWDAVLAEPAPAGSEGLAQTFHQHARGIALVRQGQAAAAIEALAQAEAGAATLRAKHASEDDATLRQLADAVLARLKAEIAMAQRQGDAALAYLALAVDASRKPDETEPPLLAGGALLALGEGQLALGRPADAEASFQSELKERPDSGWALDGLARALAAQGRGADAARARSQADRVWPQADAALRQRS